jgi:hypothetical protein
LVRLGNIVHPSPLEAVSILFHMAFVYPRTHARGFRWDQVVTKLISLGSSCDHVDIIGYQGIVG